MLLSGLRPAQAQEAINGLGPLLVPGDAGVGTPLYAWKPEVQRRWGLTAQGLMDYAKAPVVAYTFEPDGSVVEEALLDQVAGLDLGLSLGLGDRLAVQGALPTALTALTPEGRTLPGVGDLRLSAPVGLVLPGRLQGFGLSLVPTLTVPSADPDRLLGRGGWNTGLSMAYSYDAKVWGLVANTGVEAADPLTQARDLVDNPRLLANLAASWRPTPSWAVAVEGLYQPPFSSIGEAAGWGKAHAQEQASSLRRAPQDCLQRARAADAESSSIDCLDLNDPLTGADSPGEILIYLQHVTDGGLSWTLGGGAGGTNGTGTAALEAVLSVGWTPVGGDDADVEDKQEDDAQKVPHVDLDFALKVEDIDCDAPDGTGTIRAMLADPGVQPAPELTWTWTSETGEVVGEAQEVSGLAPGIYTATLQWTDEDASHMLQKTTSVGYQLEWLDLDETEVDDDDTTLEKTGSNKAWDGTGRSRNRLDAASTGWVDFDLSAGDPGWGVSLWLWDMGVTPSPAGGRDGWRAQAGIATIMSIPVPVAVAVPQVESQDLGQGVPFEPGDWLRVARVVQDDDAIGGPVLLRYAHNGQQVLEAKDLPLNADAAPTGAMVVSAALFNPGDRLVRARASFGCPLPAERYPPVRAELDGSYYRTPRHQLLFKYEEKYRDHQLSWTIRDGAGAVVATGSVPVTLGLNYLTLDLPSVGASPAFDVGSYYILDVTNDKGQRERLRFRYE